MDRLTLMAVFAHPDDEAFGTGGTLARYAAEKHNVFLVTATRGEAGGISEPGLATPSNLPYVREQELQCSCKMYGINPPIFLDYQDGQLPIVHQGQAVGKLVRIIREIKPNVLITFGADGIYGHYDHIAVHRWSTIAFDLAADPDCFPNLDSCSPHQVNKLYYLALDEEQVSNISQDGKPASVQMDGVPFNFIGYPKKTITTTIDIRKYSYAKRQGILCHASQVGRQNRFLDEFSSGIDSLFQQEYFILAKSTTKRCRGVEEDLLYGLLDN